jgi:hypothetical protein
VHNIYQNDPDIYLDELVFWLAVHHDITISKSALQKNLEEAGLTQKLLHKIARERDEQVWQEYWDVINGELGGNSDLLVMADETSKNDLTLARHFGRALAGECAAFTNVFTRGQRYSLAATISQRGYIAAKVVPGSFNSFDFFEFVAEQVVSAPPCCSCLPDLV